MYQLPCIRCLDGWLSSLAHECDYPPPYTQPSRQLFSQSVSRSIFVKLDLLIMREVLHDYVAFMYEAHFLMRVYVSVFYNVCMHTTINAMPEIKTDCELKTIHT